jgi:alanine racemase
VAGLRLYNRVRSERRRLYGAARRVVATVVTRAPDARVDAGGSRAVCRIDLEALRHNLAAIRSAIGAGVAVCGVVKADAYGHGAVPVARTLAAAGIEHLAVASLDEARELRDAGVDVPILVFGSVRPDRAREAARLRLAVTVWSAAAARALADAVDPDEPLDVHVKVDTGMHRVGALADDLSDLAAALRAAPLRVAGTMSHLACADEPGHASVPAQIDAFESALRALATHGIAPGVRHLANSAGAIEWPRARYDMVRAGIALYGCAPSPELAGRFDLEPVMHLRTRILQVKSIPAGDRVGYGHTFAATRPTRLAVLPVGYAIGYPRALSNRGEVLVRGRRAPVAGTISMDHVTIDVTDVPDAAEGDVVTLWGSDGAQHLDVMELGARAGTIGYELLTCVSPRTPRIYDGERENERGARKDP